MTRWPGELSVDVRALLKLERPLPSIPADTRARMLARVRASLAAKAEEPPISRKASSLVQWLTIAGVVCLFGAAGAFTAYKMCLRCLSHEARWCPLVERVSLQARKGRAVTP